MMRLKSKNHFQRWRHLSNMLKIHFSFSFGVVNLNRPFSNLPPQKNWKPITWVQNKMLPSQSVNRIRSYLEALRAMMYSWKSIDPLPSSSKTRNRLSAKNWASSPRTFYRRKEKRELAIHLICQPLTGE